MDRDRIIKAICELAKYDAVSGIYSSISHDTCTTAIEALESLLYDDENEEKRDITYKEMY